MIFFFSENQFHRYNLKSFFFFGFIFSKKSTYAKMISSEPGSLLIIGSFKKQTVDPDFKVDILYEKMFPF